MPTIIEQQPGWNYQPVGQDLMYAVSNNTIVAQFTKVKFIAEIHVSTTNPPNVSVNTDLVGTFKVTPNNAGVGIFNIKTIVENFMKADNLGGHEGNIYSNYKGTSGLNKPHPIHLIDEFSFNNNTARWVAVQFSIEYLGATPCSGIQDDNVVATACSEAVNSTALLLWNGYLKYTDEIKSYGQFNQNFGYNIITRTPSFLLDDANASFLTNAPTTQYANIDDYGVIGYVTPKPFLGGSAYVNDIEFKFYDSSGSLLSTASLLKSQANGAWGGQNNSASAKRFIMYFGCYPGNLQNYSTGFQALVAAGTIQGGHYTIQAMDVASNPLSQLYTINLNCPDQKGYESIRLTWLNQWGTWDYFTFNKKSTRNISTQSSTYTQLGGSWNESLFRNHGYKGGKKSFRVNANEKINMNTDFISADFNTTFEELINSPEVYMLEGYKSGESTFLTLNNYVTPVRLTTSSFTKKTVANDKLIQYTFEIEKSRTLNTQPV